MSPPRLLVPETPPSRPSIATSSAAARRVVQGQREIVGAAAAADGLHGIGRAVVAGHAERAGVDSA